jgi:hypothetical protein
MADDALAIALDSQTFTREPQPIPLDIPGFIAEPLHIGL